MSPSPNLSAKEVVELGEKIYRDHYKEQCEREHPREFVAINVLTGAAFMSVTPEGALDSAHAAAPDGIFHLIQVGYVGAFRVSYAHEASMEWVFR